MKRTLKKLRLQKETLTVLDGSQLSQVMGDGPTTIPYTSYCPATHTCGTAICPQSETPSCATQCTHEN